MMEIVYIPDSSFKAFIDLHYADKTVELTGIEKHMRWVVTRADGTKYIVRPESTQ